jgi:hypothetical protein
MSIALRVAAFAWLVGGAAWIVKILLIWENGGANTAEGVVGVAFIAGLAGLVVAGAAGGFALLRRWGVWLATAGVVLGAVATFIAFNLVDSLLQAIVPASGWFEEEVGIVGAAVLALVLGLSALSSRFPAGLARARL